MPSRAASEPKPLNPTAALFAFLWPGLGHISLGDRKRGLLIMFGVLFLFVSGLLIGGVDAVDLKRDRLWFLAQSLCGPIAFAADMANQHYVKNLPEVKQLDTTGLGRVNEMGTLFIALAGLMNLVVILDALQPAMWTPPPKRRREDDA